MNTCVNTNPFRVYCVNIKSVDMHYTTILKYAHIVLLHAKHVPLLYRSVPKRTICYISVPPLKQIVCIVRGQVRVGHYLNMNYYVH